MYIWLVFHNDHGNALLRASSQVGRQQAIYDQANISGIFGVRWGSRSHLRRKLTGKQDPPVQAPSLLGEEPLGPPTCLLITDGSLGLVPDGTYTEVSDV